MKLVKYIVQNVSIFKTNMTFLSSVLIDGIGWLFVNKHLQITNVFLNDTKVSYR